MLQWLKRSLATALGDKKDIVKDWKIIKKFNDKANKELNGKCSELLKENFHDILSIVYGPIFSGYDIWLDFGTLLGMYRDKGLIKHDLDMDFGVIINDYSDFQEKERKLLAKGFKRTRELYYNNKLMEISYDYKGLNVDFILYDREEGYVKSVVVAYLLDGFNRPCRCEAREYKVKFDGLKDDDFQGIKVRMPVNTHEYLESLYEKDFLIPNESYNWRNNPIYKEIDKNLARVNLLK